MPRCLIADDGLPYCWGSPAGYPSELVLPHVVDTRGAMTKRILLSVSSDNRAGVAVVPRSFSDVKAANPFFGDIGWAAGVGITKGFDAETFHPATRIDRQAMSAFVFRAMNPGIPDPVCDPAKTRLWTDVPATSPFCGTAEWLKTAGIATGTKYRPADPTTRSTMANMLFRAHHPGIPDRKCATKAKRPFKDVAVSTAACGNIKWLARTGIASGYTDGGYRPAEAVSRDAMTAFLHRRDTLAKA